VIPGNEQPLAPYLDAVVAYGFRGSGRFHVPGHKGGPGADPGLRSALGERALALDVPQDIHGIDIGEPQPSAYARAEALAAEAYGAQRTWFLTNGATQGNHALCLALAPLGTEVVAQRNSHASVVDGLVLSGGLPRFVAPEYDADIGMAMAVTPEMLDRGLTDHPGAKTAFVVSPTYYGFTTDVAGLVEVAHAHDAALVVDQAWGPHFGFHDDLPASALALGADAMLTSTHKIAGALTQSAMLHVGPGSRVDVARIEQVMRLMRSTSPSSLLMASLDAARRQLALHGEQLLHETLVGIRRARTKLDAVPGIAVLDNDDPLRIVLDVRGTGRTGYEVAEALRISYDVHPELATQATIILLVGMGERPEALERVAGDVEEVVKRVTTTGTTVPIVRPPSALYNEMVLPPREAFLGERENVAAEDAIGRISCESIAGYPPGIPALLPGERITREVVEYLHELVASGARLHGASHPAFERVDVLRERAAAS
jgi:arginine decarboxylase